MGLSYHYTFSAPRSVKPNKLVGFLEGVEKTAKQLGFNPTMVLNARFDNDRRREFVRRLTTGHPLTHENLKGIPMLKDNQVWYHNPIQGDCRVVPIAGILLIVTNEKRVETTFGFFRYPETLINIHGKEIAPVEIGNRWFFRGFVDSGDPRYRQIVQSFKAAGYVEEERDEFA